MRSLQRQRSVQLAARREKRPGLFFGHRFAVRRLDVGFWSFEECFSEFVFPFVGKRNCEKIPAQLLVD